MEPQKAKELFSREFWWVPPPPLVEQEPDLAVCKHLAGSQKRLILPDPPRGAYCGATENLLLLELKTNKQREFFFSKSTCLVFCSAIKFGLEERGSKVGVSVLPQAGYSDLGCPAGCLTSVWASPVSQESLVTYLQSSHRSAGFATAILGRGLLPLCQASRPYITSLHDSIGFLKGLILRCC